MYMCLQTQGVTLELCHTDNKAMQVLKNNY